MATAQSGEAVRFIASLPGRDRLWRAVDALADRRVRVAVAEQRNDPGASGVVGAPAIGTRERLELGARHPKTSTQWRSACHKDASARGDTPPGSDDDQPQRNSLQQGEVAQFPFEAGTAIAAATSG